MDAPSKLPLFNHRVLRFVGVGVLNAAINFGVLNLSFYVLGTSKIASSIIATSCALLISFLLNRHYVFSDKRRGVHQQILPFLLVSISGTLLVLNGVYILTLHLLTGHEQALISLLHALTGRRVGANFIDINFSTVVGALVALFWNYNGYRLLVFTSRQEQEEA